MSDQAVEFVENWVSDHVKGGVQSEDNAAHARALAVECVVAAMAEGISSVDISETFDDLSAFIAGEIEEANSRLASRDAGEADAGEEEKE